MTEYYTPGVYVEEIQTGTRPITAVGTSTAGFIGLAPLADALQGKVQYITNWAKFKTLYFPPDQPAPQLTASQTKLLAVQQAQQKADLQDQISKESDPTKKAALQAKLDPLLKAEQDAADTQKAQQKKQWDDVKSSLTTQYNAVKGVTGKEDQEAALKKQLDAVDTAGSDTQTRDDLQTQYNNENDKDKKAALKPKLDAANTKAQASIDAAQAIVTQQVQAAADAKKAQDQADLAAHPDRPWTALAHAVYGFFLNGGSACYVVNVGADADGSPAGGPALQDALTKLERIDEIAIVAAPGYTGYDDYLAITASCEKMRDRVGILDGPALNDPNWPADDLISLMRGETGAVDTSKVTWKMADGSQGGYVTMYSPWLQVANPNPATYEDVRGVWVPPSGHIAGIWARSDTARGVHKAPANEAVRGALDLQYQYSFEEQKLLNQRGVNLIRYFSGEGNLVWGARTLESDPLWKYLNVRRLFNQIEESIAKGTRWIVFEPNDRPLWQAIKRDVTAFLMGFWRAGALMGKTPQEAFFVKCDEENNPFDRIIKGEVHIDIGLAPVRPAEFVIFQISQYEAGTEVKVSGE